jgi:hypothetical protein
MWPKRGEPERDAGSEERKSSDLPDVRHSRRSIRVCVRFHVYEAVNLNMREKD